MQRRRAATILGVAVVVVGSVLVAAYYPYPHDAAVSVELQAYSTPAWQSTVCVSVATAIGFSWIDESLNHNATTSDAYGPLFTATVIAFGSNGSSAHPAYNATGGSGSGRLPGPGRWTFEALDTRPTETVHLTVSWTYPSSLLGRSSSAAAC